MGIGGLGERLKAHKPPNSPLTLVEHVAGSSEQRERLLELSPGTRRWLWGITITDIAAIAWMLAAGPWFDQTSKVTAVVTVGGHHKLVLILAILGFIVLVAALLKTDEFKATSRIDRILINLGRVVSVIALAGALSVIALVIALVLVPLVAVVLSVGRGILKH